MQYDCSCDLGKHRMVGSRKTPHPGLGLGNGDYRNFAGRGHAQPVWVGVGEGAREQHLRVAEVRGRE